MSEAKRVEVSGCHGCPLFRKDNLCWRCGGTPRRRSIPQDPAVKPGGWRPSWCPLRKGPVLVVLKEVE